MNSESEPKINLAARLQRGLSQVETVRQLCQVPSISLGVLHNGETVYHSVGHRDPEMKHEANPDTIYMLGSCSKMFTSAAMGILVDSKKVHWQDPVHKFLPEFSPVNDPQIGEHADFIDLLRHSTGLGDAGRLCLGSGGSILVNEADLIPLLNLMPTSNENGQRFNREWAYNNLAYGIVAQAIEQISAQRFDVFVKHNILRPLGMSRTVLTRAEIRNDTNVATPCITLKNGKFAQLEFLQWPCEHVPSLLAAAGICSSTKDMLKWCKAVLVAEKEELSKSRETRVASSPSADDTPAQHGNPLKQMNRIRRGYWTRPADDPSSSKSAAYCMGWIRLELPSSMLGAFSGNMLSREKNFQSHLRPENQLGKSSCPFLTVGHSGGMPGSSATIWTFPETQSAVVVFTNGRGLGDASDFVAQMIIQDMFDLKPRIDLIPWVKQETGLAERYFRERMLGPWEKRRIPNDVMRDPSLYTGDYEGFNGLFQFHIGRKDHYCKLHVIFNRRQESKVTLSLLSRDIYSFFIPDFDLWASKGIAVSSYEQTLLEFNFDEAEGNVVGLWWLWHVEEKREFFKKMHL